MCARNYHSYAYLILALGRLKTYSMVFYDFTKFLHDIGPANVMPVSANPARSGIINCVISHSTCEAA